MTKSSYLPSTLTEHKYVEASGYTCCYQSFDGNQRNNKDLYLVRDFNINILDYEGNVKVKNFVNFAFQISLIPLINKPLGLLE